MRAWIIFVHRYLGIALCLLFVVWFVSGIAMIYARDMPRLTPEVRLQRLAPIDLSRVRLTPAEAADKADLRASPGTLTLLTLLDRPAYRFASRRVTVFADTGERLQEINGGESLAVASQFVKLPPSQVSFVGWLDRADQWTIGQRRQLPLYKVAVRDSARTELYISERLGEVVLQTTRGSRALAWVAAIPHWLYFAPLRLNDALWRQVILWTSGLGIVSALAGVILAVSQIRVHYAGLFRWHYLAGAIVGVFALTWVFSGLLSMEPWFWASGDSAGDDIPRALSGGGGDLSAFPRFDANAWRERGELKEIEFRRIQDEAYYVVRGADARSILLGAATLQPKRDGFSVDSILQRVREAEPETTIVDTALLSDYDAYYYDRDRTAPLPIVRVRFADPSSTWVYIDPSRSELVARFTSRERLQRWLYHGLHSLDFPAFYFSRPLWDIVVIALCAGGAILSVLGTVLGFRRLTRAVQPRR